MSHPRYVSYRVLSAALMILCFALGAILFAAFVSNTLLPASMQPTTQAFRTDYWGYYMMGFAATLLVAWGGCLLAAVRNPAHARGIGTASAVALVLNAVFRVLAWFSGEYAEVGNLPRVEATVMLLLALGFIWLRPPVFVGVPRPSAE